MPTHAHPKPIGMGMGTQCRALVGRVVDLGGPLHTWDREPMTITLQALSLVEKAEPVQVRDFTLPLGDQRSE